MAEEVQLHVKQARNPDPDLGGFADEIRLEVTLAHCVKNKGFHSPELKALVFIILV